MSPAFLFVGNDPALDFLNTEIPVDGAPADRLGSFDDLVRWLLEAKLVSPAAAKRARAELGDSLKGARALGDARALRAAIRALVERAAQRKAPPADALEAVNALLARPSAHAPLAWTAEGFQRVASRRPEDGRDLLAPIAIAAARLLCEADPRRLRKCANDACVLVFHDTSKSGRRRWCSMSACGNRAKVAEHYRRSRG